MNKIKKYKLNEDYFDNIDSQEKAYILGFLYADGTINDKNQIRLSLSEKDKGILEIIKKLIGTDKPLYFHKSVIRDGYICKPLYELNIINKHMADSLKKLGLVPRKTHILTFPEWLNIGLYPHFIRGYFDGDGSIAHMTKTDSYVFSLAGTYKFLERSQEILIKNCSLSKNTINNSKSISVLMYGGSKQLINIREFLYKDATIFLKRKKDVFDKVISKDTTINIDDSFLKDLFNKFQTNKELAEELGISYKSVYRKLRDVGISRGRYTVTLDEKEVVRLYKKELKTAQEIGDLFGTTHTTIYKILRRNNISIRPSHEALKSLRFLEPNKKDIFNLYIKDLWSFKKIADKYKVNPNTINDFLLKNNIEIRDRNETKKSVIEDKKLEIIDFLKKGKKVYEIASYYGVTEAVIGKFFRRWGISSRSIKNESN